MSYLPDHTYLCRPIEEKEKVRLRWLLLIASILLVSGLFMPMMTITKFFFLHDRFSVVSGVFGLFSNGNYVLSVVVFLFSIVLPLLKVLVLFGFIAPKPRNQEMLNKQLHRMHDYGRWAMLDVLVVAILIVTVKLGALASVSIHAGLYVFGFSVVMIMLLTRRVVHLTVHYPVPVQPRSSSDEDRPL